MVYCRAISVLLRVPDDAQGDELNPGGGDDETAVQAVDLTTAGVLDLLYNPGRLAKAGRRLSAHGRRKAADDEGCPEPGQEAESPWQASA